MKIIFEILMDMIKKSPKIVTTLISVVLLILLVSSIIHWGVKTGKPIIEKYEKIFITQ